MAEEKCPHENEEDFIRGLLLEDSCQLCGCVTRDEDYCLDKKTWFEKAVKSSFNFTELTSGEDENYYAGKEEGIIELADKLLELSVTNPQLNTNELRKVFKELGIKED